MPTNLLKIYNQVLELLYRTDYENIASIKNVFYRDFNVDRPLVFNAKTIPNGSGLRRMFEWGLRRMFESTL